MKRITTTALATVGALAGLGIGGSDAEAGKKKQKKQSAFGYVRSGPFSGLFSAERVGKQPVTGTFSGGLRVGNGSGLGAVKGPITCLEVRDDSVGLFFPFREPDLGGSGMLVSVRTDDSNVRGMSFKVLSTSDVTSCAPEEVSNNADGTVTLRQR